MCLKYLQIKKQRAWAPKTAVLRVQEGQTVTAGRAGGRTPYHPYDADLIGSQRTNIKKLWRRVPPEKACGASDCVTGSDSLQRVRVRGR